MSRWKPVITNVGLNLLSNVTDSRAINIVAVKGGTGKISENNLNTQTDIVGYVCDLQITSSEQTSDTNYRISARLANDNVTDSFYLTQVGVYATLGSSTNQILFMIIQCTDEGDVIPAGVLSKGFVATYQINLAFSNAENVNIEVKPLIEGLAAVATSGSYSDLTDKPNLAAVATSGSYSDLTDKPNLAAVATSGSYSDLTDKPNTGNGVTVYTINAETFSAGLTMDSKAYAQIHNCKNRVIYIGLLSQADKSIAESVGLALFGGSAAQGYVGIEVTQGATFGADLKLAVVDLGAYTPDDGGNGAVIINGL